MKSKSSKRKSITRLHDLVNELSDRDDQLKKDMRLFEEFFETFPIPVTMWSISLERTILSKRGNGFVAHEADCLENLFLCPEVKSLSIDKHEKALLGEKVDYFAKSKDSVFYVKLLPRKDDNGKICGVTGVSWDVTSNAIILSCLEDIFEATLGKRGAYKIIHQKSERALSSSRLRHLLVESEEE
jgi:hypothetical protein|tara:strand:- start:1220 stop:1774 length:555 start_codon:yes stop_codon:yes gene_type:complete